MILSFHPIFIANKNIICAGRNPNIDDLSAIQEADAVILPQGCSERLYTMAKSNCINVFPNYDAKFQFSGKINQIKLFQKTGSPHPKTEIFPGVNAFKNIYGHTPSPASFLFPVVFKFNWGGEGDTVYLVSSAEELNDLIDTAEIFEKTGQSGFLIQEQIHSKSMSLRVNVIGRKLISFWRIPENNAAFYSNLSKGGRIEYDVHPDLQEAAKKAVGNFCGKTGINLAGFDILFSFDGVENQKPEPLFLEINYFFGRRGLGGSEKFYQLLVKEINQWLTDLGLSVKPK